MNNDITGIWETDPGDTKSIQLYGNVSMEFKAGGELVYTTRQKGKMQKMFMTFEIKDNVLITAPDPTSAKEKTEFKLLPNGKLELTFEGIKSTYIKVSNQ